jgi:Reverse transcriptase (RNA-dependent DNA polymerase)/Pao retrotransposon peptidase
VTDGTRAKYYVPIFTLEKESLTTKTRLLFSCDQKTSNGKSVNDIQHAGPKLQNDMRKCLLKFRYKKFAVVGDIGKMYLRIKVDEEDRAFQRTFIMMEKEGEIKEMELSTLIFGMKSSPFLAISVLFHIAEKLMARNPKLGKAIRDNFYVDDWMISFDSATEASQMLTEVMEELRSANLPLQKIASSHTEVVENVQQEYLLEAVSKDFDDEGQASDVKVLGMAWNKKNDVFQYKVKLEEIKEPITKRKAVSVASKIWDMTGCLIPALLPAKLLVQEMWKTQGTKDGKADPKSGWDSPVSNDIALSFMEWYRQLPALEIFDINAGSDTKLFRKRRSSGLPMPL